MLIGAALGVVTLIGSSMLLYFAPQLLRTTGFLIGLVLIALACGVWVTGSHAWAASRRRWLLLILSYIVGGIYASFWTTQPSLRATTLGSGLAALLLLAQPAYASGALLASVTRGARGAIAAIVGAALGASLGAALLIPAVDVDVIFFGTATVLLVAWLWYEAAAALPQTDHAFAPMTGKTVLVTGVGNPGQVGYALAAAFVKAGARVVAVDRHDTVEALGNQLGGQSFGLVADLTTPADVEALLLAVQERCGALHAVINAAGGLSVIKPLAETEIAEWRREIERNSDTAFLVSRAALPLLRQSRGAIVNFAAPAGQRAQAKLGAYSAAKAAVVALTRALALEEKENGVRVNAIAPGMIDTEQNRSSVPNPEQVHWVTRTQIANAVLFLCSAEASAITGETIHVLGEGIE